MQRTAQERFWAKVSKTGDCWLWTAGLTTGGYGKFGLSAGVTVRAHRLAYEWLIGPVPDGLDLDHLCRVRNCVNPAHLEPVTNAENLRRAAALRTRCSQGHPYDEANTWLSTEGHRQCRTCDRERKRKSKGYRRDISAGLTECINGHEFTPENTRIRPGGRKACRTCARDAMRRHRARAADA